MSEPLDFASRSNQSLLNSEVDAFVTVRIDKNVVINGIQVSDLHEDDVSHFGIGRNCTGNGGKAIRIEDSFFDSHELCEFRLQFEMNVCEFMARFVFGNSSQIWYTTDRQCHRSLADHKSRRHTCEGLLWQIRCIFRSPRNPNSYEWPSLDSPCRRRRHVCPISRSPLSDWGRSGPEACPAPEVRASIHWSVLPFPGIEAAISSKLWVMWTNW